MRVSSPIGELPFVPERIALRERGVRIEGAMGAWPASVQIDASDLPAAARLLARPAGAVAAGVALLFGLTRMVGHRTRTEGN